MGLTSYVLDLFMYATTVVLSLVQEVSCWSIGLGTLLGPRKLLLVPGSVHAACFQEGTRFLLQCSPK